MNGEHSKITAPERPEEPTNRLGRLKARLKITDGYCRLLALWYTLRGRPTMYRIEFIGMPELAHPHSDGLITQCTFTSKDWLEGKGK